MLPGVKLQKPKAWKTKTNLQNSYGNSETFLLLFKNWSCQVFTEAFSYNIKQFVFHETRSTFLDSIIHFFVLLVTWLRTLPVVGVSIWVRYVHIRFSCFVGTYFLACDTFLVAISGIATILDAICMKLSKRCIAQRGQVAIECLKFVTTLFVLRTPNKKIMWKACTYLLIYAKYVILTCMLRLSQSRWQLSKLR